MAADSFFYCYAGPEIRKYWQSVAQKYDVYSKTKFQTKVLGSYWEPDCAQWRLETESVLDGGRTSEHFDFLITAIGHFNQWRLPDYPGIDQYKGELRHSSNWDTGFDATGKSIATVSCPNIQVALLTHTERTVHV